MIFAYIFQSAIDRELSDIPLFDVLLRQMEWRKVWIWEVSVVHSIFFGPQRRRVSLFVIPSTGLLVESSTAFVDLYLTSVFDIYGSTDRGE